jgi:hypothetical protein
VPRHAVGQVHVVGAHVVAVRLHAAHQPAQTLEVPPLRAAAGALRGRGAEGDGAARRRRVAEVVAEHVELLVGDDPLDGVEGVLAELDHHRVGPHEAEAPRRISGHGDAPARQLRCDRAQGAVEADEVQHGQRLKTMPRSGKR